MAHFSQAVFVRLLTLSLFLLMSGGWLRAGELVVNFNSSEAVGVSAESYDATGHTVDLTLGFAPAVGSELTVVRVTEAGFIEGRFDNLAQGQEISFVRNGITYRFVVDYFGGTGNDLVLRWANTRLFAWGLNNVGQLGLGFVPETQYTSPGSVPVSSGPKLGALAGKHIFRLATGSVYASAIRTDGSLVSWGGSDDGLRLERSVPAVVENGGILHGRTVVDIVIGRDDCLALCSDGTLVEWGVASRESTPVRYTPTDALVGKTVVAIDGGSLHKLALCSDGTMVAWGYGTGGVLGNGSTSRSGPVAVDHSGVLAGKTVVKIAAGYNHNLALCSDNTLVAWGSNDEGAVGDDSTTSRSVPVLVNRSGVLANKTIIDIAAGEDFSLALCSDGTLAAWGTDNRGQLGNAASSTSRLLPVQVPKTGVLTGKQVVGIEAGWRHALAVCSDGSLVGWGDSDEGQLGFEGSTAGYIPVLVSSGDLRPGEKFVDAYSGITSQFSFGLVASPPASIVTTHPATQVSDTVARLHAQVTANGSATTVGFEFGLTEEYGEWIAASPSLIGGTSSVAISATLNNLRSGATYHYRVVGESNGGLSYGEDRTFTTTRVAELKSLVSDSGTMTPAFKSDLSEYTIMVPFSTASLTLTPVANDPGASIEASIGGGSVGVGGVLPLAPGDTVIEFEVTSANGTVRRVYQVTVTRLPEVFAISSPTDVPLTAGRISLDGEIAELALKFPPAPGTSLTLIENTGAEPIHGRFGNLEHGQLVDLEYHGVRYPFAVNYFGGPGFNDLVLHWGNTRVMAWGYSQLLGNDATEDGLHPVEVDHSGGLAGRTVVAVEAGESVAAALCVDGTVYTWGSNDRGQLGIGSSISASGVPVAVNVGGVLADRQVVSLAGGGSHMLALCADGGVVGWGANNKGQLGDGVAYVFGRSVPVAVDSSGVLSSKSVVALSAGYEHSLALCNDGTLVAWGSNTYGQLGNGMTLDSSSPVEVDRSGVLAGKTVASISAGNYHNMVLCTDGTLVVWGRGSEGALGINSTENQTVPVRGGRLGALSGKLVKEIAAGASHNVVLCSDGTLASWGGDAYDGRLGDGSSSGQALIPVRVDQSGVLSGKTVTEITSGTNHNLVACSDGTFAAWGANSFGQLGNGTATRAIVPVLLDGSFPGEGRQVVSGTLSAGSAYSLALVGSPAKSKAETLPVSEINDYQVMLNGRVNANGNTSSVHFEYGRSEALGASITAVPASVSGTSDTLVTATLTGLMPRTTYYYRACVESAGEVIKGETLSFTTSGFADLAGLLPSDGELVPIFDSSTTSYALTVPAGVTSISLVPEAVNSGGTITVNGVAVASGTSSSAINLGVGNTLVSVVVTAADGVNVRTYQVTVIRLPEVVSWNNASEVPAAASGFRLSGNAPPLTLGYHPASGESLTILNNTGLAPIHGTFDDLVQGQRVVLPYEGGYYEFVVNYFGGTGNDLVLHWAHTKLFGWGSNQQLQLGLKLDANSASVPIPLDALGPLAGKTILDVAAGEWHSIFLCADGTLFAAGLNDSGQLGVSLSDGSSFPQAVDRSGILAGKTVIQVAAGGRHSLALCADGTVAAWGENGDGQLGIGSAIDSNVPVPVETGGVLSGKRVVRIAAGDRHSLALCSDGSVVTWGLNQFGQLGNNSVTSARVPVAVDRKGILLNKEVRQIAAGVSHSVALCMDGTIATWGQGGWLGNGLAVDSSVPVAVVQDGVLAGRTVVQVDVGLQHSVALCDDGTVVSWGDGYNCQLGNGNCYTNSKVPVVVDLMSNFAGKFPVAVTAESERSFAVFHDGTAASWGNRGAGLGNGNANVSVPVPLPISLENLQSGERVMALFSGTRATASFAVVSAALKPGVVTGDADLVRDTTTTLHSEIFPNGNEVEVAFEYGLTAEYGLSIEASPGQVSGTGAKEVMVSLGNLIPGTTYHYRSVARGGVGVSYGEDRTFTTSSLAVLSGLALSEGILDPPFSALVTEYHVMVSHAATSVTVFPTGAHAGATVTVNGVAVDSGGTSSAIPLGVGSNAMALQVSSGAGGSTVDYRVVVTRLPERFSWLAAEDVPVTVEGFAPHGVAPLLELQFEPTVGAPLTVVDNTGLDPITGSFADWPQGKRVMLEYEGISYPYYVNYFGGTGNDLVLEWGSSRLLGWGTSSKGQLGIGTLQATNSSPVPIVDSGVLANKVIRQVSIGSEHTLALCWDGTLVAWGENSNGELGDATTTDRLVPVAVDMTGVLAGKEVIDVSAEGQYRSYAVCSDGTVAVWGQGETKPRLLSEALPELGALAGKQVIDIESGRIFDLALCSDGMVVAWGSNYSGQLGIGTRSDSAVPVAVHTNGVLAGKRVVRIAAGSNHSLALCSDGTLVEWGSDNGPFNVGGEAYRVVPVAVSTEGVLSGRTVVDIVAAGSTNGALCSDGTVATWGSNFYGTLGNGSSTGYYKGSFTPVEVDRSGVLAGKTVTGISGGAGFLLASTTDGAIAAWGANNQGQLGDTTTTNQSIPVRTDMSSLGADENLIRGAALSTGGGSAIAIVGTWPAAMANTLAAESIQDGSAALQGEVWPNQRTTEVWFEFGLSPNYGTRLDPSQGEVSGVGSHATSFPLIGLKPGTTYHYRMVASNSEGTVYGDDQSFTTSTLATLANLTADAAELLPTFDGARTDYALTVDHATTSLSLEPTANSPSAVVTVNGAPVASGAASGSIALEVGNTVIPVVVSLDGGVNTLTYRVTVTRPPDAFVFRQADDVAITAPTFDFSGKLSLGLGFAPENGIRLTVASATGLARSRGSFENLEHGQTIDLEFDGVRYRFVVNYFGGTGNDLVLEWANVRVLAWGENGSGQLGAGVAAPVLTKPTPLGIGSRVLDGKSLVDIACGSSHSLALYADGTLAAWGGNEQGQLGVGSREPRGTPGLVDQSGFLAGRTVVAVAAGSFHSLALCSDGTLVGWGDNTSGQLGNAGSLFSGSPILIEEAGSLAGKEISVIEAGWGFNLALCTDGTLTAWGSNSVGQLGIGNLNLSFSPFPRNVSEGSVLEGRELTSLAAGYSHALVLDSEGKVYAWGFNYSGQLGIGSQENQIRPLAVPREGALADKQVVAISAGGSHSLALCSDGTLVAWGSNNDGQLGIGSTSDSLVPVVVDQSGILAGKEIVEIVAESNQSLVRCADGTIAAWGNHRSEILGLVESASYRVTVPMAVDVSALGPDERLMSLDGGRTGHRFMVVAAGPLARVETLAASELREDSVVLRGGVAANGDATEVGFEFGVGPNYGESTSFQVIEPDAAVEFSEAIAELKPGATYHYRAIARSGNGTAYGQDRTFTTGNSAALASLVLSEGSLSPAFSSDRHRYIATVPAGTSSATLSMEAVDGAATVRVNGGLGTSIALEDGSNVISIKVSSADGLGTQTYTVDVTRLPAAFAFGSATDAAITATRFVVEGNAPEFSLSYAPVPGTALMVIDQTGSLPLEGTFENLNQGEVVSLTHEGITYPFFANYFGGDGNDLVLEWATKRLVAWGNNYTGQLGDDTSDPRSSPVRVKLEEDLAGKLLLSVLGAGAHSLALFADGTMAAWGDNGFGQLGDGSTLDSWIPQLVDGTGVLAGKHVIRIAVGQNHNLALCSDGTLVAWGENKYGELGIGSVTGFENSPVLVDGSGVLAGKRVTDIAAGSGTSYAVCSDGTIVSWGLNNRGQLGDGSNTNRNRPVLVVRNEAHADQLVTALGAGPEHCLALLDDGKLLAWGRNNFGQLGIGNNTDQLNPVEVDATGILAGKTVVGMAAGDTHSFALCSDNTLVGWGNNFLGRLGNDSTTNSSVPIQTGLHGVLVGKTIEFIDAFSIGLALSSDGSISTWGYGNSGSLGNGTFGSGSFPHSLVPVAVDLSNLQDGERVVAASPGNSFVIAQVASPPLGGALTLAASDLRDVSAVLQGQAIPNGSETIPHFEYGRTSAYGTSVAAVPATVGGTVPANVSVLIDGLRAGTTYHYRLVCESTGGIVYGEDRAFTTTSSAVLAGLESSDGHPAPAWEINRLNYSITVPSSTTQISLTPMGASAGSTVSVNGSPVAAGAASAPIALSVGNRVIPIEVTGADGVTKRSYAVTVTRIPEVISLEGSEMAPVSVDGFDAGGLDITLELNHAPEQGASLPVVQNGGLEPIWRSFRNLAQGESVTLDFAGIQYRYVADYFGGTGNDLVLRWANARVYAWGRNSNGQAGNSSGSDLYSPSLVEWSEMLGEETPMSISVGGSFSAMVLSDGRILTWGSNSYGALGGGETVNPVLPVEVDLSGVLEGKTVVAIAAGGSHTLALCSDGTLASWGYNQYGQLGDGGTENRSVPVGVERSGALADKRVVAIAAGNSHSLALCSDGTVVSWGRNNAGQLGNGRYQDSSIPLEVIRTGVLAGKQVLAVAAGGEHNLALCADNTLASWGADGNGELGNGAEGTSGEPVLVDRSGLLAGKIVTDIAAGGQFNVVLCADGTLAAWGYNSNSRLGGGVAEVHESPIQVGNSGGLPGRTIDAISLGNAHGMALDADGALLTWGDRQNGRLGFLSDYSVSFPAQIPQSALAEGERFIEALSGSSASHSLAIVAASPRPTVETLAAIDVSNGGATLRGMVHPNGGSATAWFEYGVDESYGNIIAAAPTELVGSSEAMVHATLSGLLPGVTYHYRAVASGSGGVSRGGDEFFTVGVGAALADLSMSSGGFEPGFEPSLLDYATAVSGATESITVTPISAASGALVTVNGSAVVSGSASQAIPLTSGDNLIVIAVKSADGAVTHQYRVAVTRLPSAFRIDTPEDRPLITRRLVAAGQEVPVELGYAPLPGTELTLVEVTGFKPIAGQFSNLTQGEVLLLDFEGKSYSFVVDYFGGSGNDLVLRWLGSRVFGWGQGATPNSTLPVEIGGQLAGETLRITGAGASHRFAVLVAGSVFAWGSNASGQLGDGTTVDRNKPVQVDQSGILSGKNVVAVTGGIAHSLALCADGTLVAWGSNSDGQLGTGTRSGSVVPVSVNASGVLAYKTVVAIAAGGNCSYALCSDGTVVAWGDNQYGTLGDGTTLDRSTPVLVDRSGVLAGKTVVAIAAGDRHAVVLCSDGTLASWGYGGDQALGNAGNNSSYVPVLVDRTGVLLGRTPVAITAGGKHSHALCSDGRIASWGTGSSGQLGVGRNLSSSNVPVLVASDGVLDGRTVVEIAAGGAHSLALCSDGALVGWGANFFGELGLGYTADRLTSPVLVDVSGLSPGEAITSVFSSPHSRASYAVTAISGLPSVGTLAATSVRDTSAVLHGEILPSGIAGEIWFEFGSGPDYGGRVSATPAGADGTLPVLPSATLTGLNPGATYHYRLVYETDYGTFAGEDRTLTATAEATLAGLAADQGQLFPSFDPLNNLYAATVPSDATHVRLTATSAHQGASVTINGTSVSSGAPSPPIPLSPGTNTLVVVVSGAAGDTREYLVQVLRIPEEMVFDTPGIPFMTSDLISAVGVLPPIRLGHLPATGSRLTIFENTGSSQILGTFDNLRQGEMVALEFEENTYHFLANYFGGDGNDLVLEWGATRLVGWGDNQNGELANGTLSDSRLPYPAGLGGVLTGKRVFSVATGEGFSIALAADGTLAAWGWNRYGLGHETLTSSQVPIAVDQSGVLAGKTVIQISANRYTALALCSDGSMAAWGFNGNREFGVGSAFQSSLVPVKVDPGGVLSGKLVSAVATGLFHSMALCSDGTVYTWGVNNNGQLGDNSTQSRGEPTPVDTRGALNGRKVVAIKAGTYFSLALCSDGTLVSWGENTEGQLGNGSTVSSSVPVVVDQSGVLAGKRVVDIAAGGAYAGEFALALCADGTVVAWGAGSGGRLGNGSETNRSSPVLVDQTGVLAGKTVIDVKISKLSCFALCDDGTLVAWGFNSDGNLGDGGTANRSRPVETALFTLFPGERLVDLSESSSANHVIGRVAIPVPVATTLASTEITGLSVTLNGSVQVNGFSSSAWFELGTTSDYGTIIDATPSLFNRRSATPVAAGVVDLTPDTVYHYRVVVENEFGTIKGGNRSFRTLSDNALLASLTVNKGELGPDFDKEVSHYFVTVPNSTGSVTLSPVTEHFGARVLVGGEAVASGGTSSSIPVAVGATSIATVVTAEDGITMKTYTVTVTRLPEFLVFGEDGQAPVSANGFSARGVSPQLVLDFEPVPGTIIPVVDNTSLEFIHGRFANLAQGQRVSLRFGSGSYAYVANYHGGDGNDLVLQWATTEVLAWGANRYGQLGDGTTERRLVPTRLAAAGPLEGKTVTAVSSGYLHNLALCSDGSLAAWGYNVQGQLGNGSSEASLQPVSVDQSGVLAGKTVIAIAAGPYHNLVLCDDGSIAAWGLGNYGQLGAGDTNASNTPVLVEAVGALAGKQVVGIAAASYHSVARCADGSVVSWGYNDEGELGNGSMLSSLVPVEIDRSGVLAGKQVSAISVGQYHTLAQCRDGSLVAWGYNGHGELGDGSTVDAASPVFVDTSTGLAGKTVVAISAGGSHSLARCDDGSLVAWGRNHRSQLGSGAVAESLSPVVLGFAPEGEVRTVAANWNHNLMVMENGQMSAWGDNAEGQLGDNTRVRSEGLVAVDASGLEAGSRFMLVAGGASSSHSLAVLALPNIDIGEADLWQASFAAQAGDLGDEMDDLDGDGIPNIIEYAFGLDPQANSAGQLPVPQVIDGHLVLRFEPPAEVEGIVYGAEWSATMKEGSWQALPDEGSVGEHLFRLPTKDSGKGFIRLKIDPR